MDHYERQWLQQMIAQSQAETIERYKKNASAAAGAGSDVQPWRFNVAVSTQVQTLPPGCWLPVPDVANLRVPMSPTSVNANGCVIQSFDGGFFVESGLPVINVASVPLTLQYRAGVVRQGAVGLQYQTVVTGFGQDVGWDFVGPWQILVVDPASSIIQSLRTFNGPVGGFNINLGTAGWVATISGVARF